MVKARKAFFSERWEATKAEENPKVCTFFLICRRARRQRSQSPVLGTLRIDKHFELYNEYH